MGRVLLVLAVAALAAAAARADVVHYKDGRELEGVIVERTATSVTVETTFGTIDVPMSKVRSIEEKPTPAQELARRREEIADGDAAALWQLARWADEQSGLRREHRELLEEVVAADPDHEQARAALGHVRVDGRWFRSPEEAEAHKAAVAEEKRAQGLMLHEGEWLPEEEVMTRRGLRRYKGEWRPRREVETLAALADLARVVGWHATATEGEHVTIFSSLDDADALEFLVYDLDTEVSDFLSRLRLVEEEIDRVAGREIPVYLAPDQATADALVTAGFLERYPRVRDHASWVGEYSFGMNWPRAFLVLVDGGWGAGRSDRAVLRTGILAHQIGKLLIDRFKGSRNTPPWARVGLAAYYEGLTNYHQTLSLTTDHVDERGRPVDLWVDGWNTIPAWRDRLKDERELRALPPLVDLLRSPGHDFDSRDIGVCWSLVRYLLEQHPMEFVAYLRAYDADPFRIENDAGRAHDRAWRLSFADTEDDIETDWKRWALAQPSRFPTDEFDR